MTGRPRRRHEDTDRHMTSNLRRLCAALILSLPPALFGALPLAAVPAATAATATTGAAEAAEPLAPTERHHRISMLVTEVIEKSHYRGARIDDLLSAEILDHYIDVLDNNKFYFLHGDIRRFQRYRHSVDDMVHGGDLTPIFEIFETYRERAAAQLEHAIALLEEEPDFTVDEAFVFEREDALWAPTQEALDEIWRQRVKNDALNEILSDETWEEARETLAKRYQRILTRFEQITADDVFESFMNAYAHTLDPHSSYLSPRNSEEYRIQMSLSYFGIGASLRMEDDYVTVMDIIPGGPAAIDGSLEPTDRIIAVGEGTDGELVDVIGWRLDDVVERIRGPAGTTVRLRILSKDAMPGSGEEVLALVRDKVKLEEQAAKSEIVEVPRDGRVWSVGVLRIPSFYRDYEAQRNGEKDFKSTTRDVRRLIAELEAEGIDGLVVDLRNNGGGHLSEATALSGLFIDRGPVVQLRDSSGRLNVLPDPEPRIAYDGPLVVLVNRLSASASEIFAAAIQDYERGVVVGQQTFGKGSVQNLYPLDRFVRRSADPGMGQLTLTIGKYYRVTGDSTQHRGVSPDIALPSRIDAAELGESTRDTALPWDQIPATRYRAGKELDPKIAVLADNFAERIKGDPDHEYLLQDIEAARETRRRRSVSLNLETRREEREQLRAERLARENARRIAHGLEPLASLEALEELEENEEADTPERVLLREAAGIAADMAELDQLPQRPRSERAAQLREDAELIEP